MSLRAFARLPLDPPIDPSGDEGRRLLRDELEKLPYQERKSLVDTITKWLSDQLEGVVGGSAGTIARILLVLLVAALLALIIFAATRIRSSRRARTGTSDTDAVLEENDVSAAEYRRRAAEADARGDHDAALLDWFRALARASDERALLGEAPARTAHELVVALVPFFPEEAAALRHAGDAFDDVRYGSGRAGPTRSNAMRELDDRLTRARPRHGEADEQDTGLAVPGRWAP